MLRKTKTMAKVQVLFWVIKLPSLFYYSAFFDTFLVALGVTGGL